MVKIKDSARITVSSLPEGAVPDVSPAGIDATAQLVWTSIINQIDRAKARRDSVDGRPGFLWQGKVSRMIDTLWPELSGGYHLTSAERKAIKLEINRYHRDSGNLICRQRAARGGDSLWWVSEHWSGLAVSHVTDASQDTPKEAEEPTLEQESGDESYACRAGCPYTSEYAQIRASHERREHGVRFTKTGEKIMISSEPLEDIDLQSLIIRIATESEKPEARYYFLREARKIDPRVTQPRVFAMLKEMADSPKWDLVAHGTSEHYTYYTLASKVVQEVDNLVTIYRSEDAVIDISTPTPEPVPASNGLFTDHVANLRRLVSDLEVLDSMELELSADLQAQLTAANDQNATLKAELEDTRNQLLTVTRERDQLKSTLDTIRTQILGKGN